MKIKYNKVFVLLCAFVLILSCSKDDNSTEPINLNGGEIFRSQVVSISLTDADLNEAQYDATLDGIAIKLSKASTNSLTFLVPQETPLGLKDLVIPAFNNLTVNYEVKESVLTQSPSETLAPLIANLNTFTQALDSSLEATEAQATMDSFNTFYANATEEQKAELALIYKVNQTLFDSIILDTYAGRLNSNASCFATAVLGMGASIVLIISPSGVTQIAGITLFAVSFMRAKKCGKPLYNEYVLANNIKFNGFPGISNRLAASVSFNDDVSTNVALDVMKRKLIASDSNKTESVWVSFFSNFNILNAHVSAANYAISVVNNLPFVNFAPLTPVTLPATSANIDVNADPAMFNNLNFTLNHPNLQLVSASMPSSGQMSIKIKIIGTPTTLPVASFLNYSYTDEYNTFTGNIDIEVHNEIDLSGVWSLDVTLPPSGICDEVLIMDELNATLQLQFNSDNTITFLNDPSGAGLNGSGFSQTYTIVDDVLAINIDDSEGSTFQATLQYNSNISNDFNGNYTNNWVDGDQCTNSIHIYK